MKIESIQNIHTTFVTTNEGEYRRISADSWEELMGMSWEDISHQDKVHKLEEEFQRYIEVPFW